MIRYCRFFSVLERLRLNTQYVEMDDHFTHNQYINYTAANVIQRYNAELFYLQKFVYKILSDK